MAARWTVIFQLRAVEVAVRCVRARAVPPDASRRRCAAPAAGAKDVRARHELVRDMLTGASDDPASRRPNAWRSTAPRRAPCSRCSPSSKSPTATTPSGSL
ncbi:unnamed protein product [Urochloa humidicola]